MSFTFIKIFLLSFTLTLLSEITYAQPVADSGVVPVSISLDQILRINITGGGNVEFVFNSIQDYKNGIANSSFYDTNLNVGSSSNWEMSLGADNINLVGSDNPVNTMALGNICLQIASSGVYSLGATNYTDPVLALSGFIDLPVSGTVVIGDGVAGNAGNITDNVFTINWEAGTASCTASAAMNMLLQSIAPDRYVTNVLIDINIQ